MAMRIADASSDTQGGPANELALLCAESNNRQIFHYWRGASGRRYLHNVYSLVACSAMPKANYILVYCDEVGQRTPLRIGRTVDEAGTLNLAHLRQRAAQLGANEIHVYLLAETAEDRKLAETDLRVGLFAELSAEVTVRLERIAFC